MSSIARTSFTSSIRCLSAIGALCAAVSLTACEAWESDDRDETISYGELPAAVQRTIDANLEGGAIEEIDVSRDDGRVISEVEASGTNGVIKFSVADDGPFLGMDTEDEDDQDADDVEDEEEEEEEKTTAKASESQPACFARPGRSMALAGPIFRLVA